MVAIATSYGPDPVTWRGSAMSFLGNVVLIGREPAEGSDDTPMQHLDVPDGPDVTHIKYRTGGK